MYIFIYIYISLVFLYQREDLRKHLRKDPHTAFSEMRALRSAQRAKEVFAKVFAEVFAKVIANDYVSDVVEGRYF